MEARTFVTTYLRLRVTPKGAFILQQKRKRHRIQMGSQRIQF